MIYVRSEYQPFELNLPDAAPQAAVFVAHGLNLKPERMRTICEFLNANGAASIRMALYGHRARFAELRKVERSYWLEDYKQIAPIQEDLRKQFGPSLKFYFIGKSLGALSFLDAYTEGLIEGIEKAVFIAPAFELRSSSRLIKPVANRFPWLVLPSASRSVDRLYRSLPLSVYRAIYQLNDALLEKLNKKPCELDCQIYMHSKDELVSYKKVVSLIETKALSNAKLFSLDGYYDQGQGYHHVMIDEQSMGSPAWNDFKKNTIEFFEIG